MSLSGPGKPGQADGLRTGGVADSANCRWRTSANRILIGGRLSGSAAEDRGCGIEIHDSFREIEEKDKGDGCEETKRANRGGTVNSRRESSQEGPETREIQDVENLIIMVEAAYRAVFLCQQTSSLHPSSSSHGPRRLHRLARNLRTARVVLQVYNEHRAEASCL